MSFQYMYLLNYQPVAVFSLLCLHFYNVGLALLFARLRYRIPDALCYTFELKFH